MLHHVPARLHKSVKLQQSIEKENRAIANDGMGAAPDGVCRWHNEELVAYEQAEWCVTLLGFLPSGASLCFLSTDRRSAVIDTASCCCC